MGGGGGKIMEAVSDETREMGTGNGLTRNKMCQRKIRRTTGRKEYKRVRLFENKGE